MKIHEVMRLTGLTRKAIYFYEREGLVQPQVDASNQYRDYSPADVERLRTIAALRSLEFPLKDIAALLDEAVAPLDIVRVRLAHIREQRERLGRVERLLSSVCERGSVADGAQAGSRGEIVDMICSGAAACEASRKLDADYLSAKLGQLFPGAFGRLIALHYGAFLDEPLDSPAKQEAWDELVEYLDGVEEFDLPPVVKELDVLTEDDYERIRTFTREQLAPYIAPDEATYRQLLSQAAATMNSDSFRQYSRTQAEFVQPLKRELADRGFYEGVVRRLAVLSSSYQAYQETLRRLQRDLGLPADGRDGWLTI